MSLHLVPEPPDPTARAEARRGEKKRWADVDLAVWGAEDQRVRDHCDLPILFEFDFGFSARTRKALFFVDVKPLLFADRATIAILLGDFDLFFEAAGRSGLG